MGVAQGVVEQSGSDEPRGVGHVYHEQGAHFVGYGTHALVIPLAGVGRAASDDEFRTFAQGYFFHLVVVDASGLARNVVFARAIDDS